MEGQMGKKVYLDVVKLSGHKHEILSFAAA